MPSAPSEGLRPGRAVFAVAAAGLLVIAAVLGAAWKEIDPVVDSIAGVGDRRLPALEWIQSARQQDLGAGVALRNALLLRSEKLSREETQRFRRLQEKAASDLEKLAGLELSPDAARQLSEVMVARLAMMRVRDEASAFVYAEPAAMSFDTLSERLQQGLDAYLQALRQLERLEGGEVSSSVIGSHAGTQQVSRLLLLAAGLSSALLLYLAWAYRRALITAMARKDEEIARLALQRDAIVREVHHRIKNHLQGLLSLMDAQRLDGPAPGQLDALRGHVMALMALHGLQASQADEGVPLQQLLQMQVRLIQTGFPAARLHLETSHSPSLTVPGPCAVQVALIVTELIVNAIKHGSAASARVTAGTLDGVPFVEVRNPASPGAFPIGGESAPGGGSAGHGLSLIEALCHGLGRIVRDPGSGSEVSMRLEMQALAR